jgi:hypothetical protein
MNFVDHNPPHFHADYQVYKAAFDIASGRLIAGEFPRNAQRLIKVWTIKNKKGLIDNWKRAQTLDPLIRIPGEE